MTVPLVSFELPYEDAVHSNNGAVTVPILFTETRHRQMIRRMDELEELWLGWLDEWPSLEEDFIGARGTLLEILYTKSRNDPVHGAVESVEAVGVGAFVVRQIQEEEGIVRADVEVEKGNPMLSVVEHDEAQEDDEDDDDREDDNVWSEDRASISFVPTHSTCTTRGIVVNMHTQHYKKDRWGQGHLFAFTIEVQNNTDDRVRIMQRQWRVRAGGLQVEA
eukprot:COSAG02_NODE_1833_length_10721_cov_4.893523_1_plen_220_part_00